jgi:ATP-dependent protease ClpP protease subunit
MVGHIYIYGEIANLQDKESSEYGVVSLSSVVNAVNTQQDAEEFIVHIHSVGGDVYEGLAIYDFLNSLDKKVTTVNEGLTASIATVVYLAGDERQATPNSQIFIHNAWTMTIGDADELAKQSEGLRKYNELISDIYVSKTNLTKEESLSLMKVETEFNSDQQIEKGFATIKVEKLKAVAKINTNKMNIKDSLKKISDDLGITKKEIKNVMLTLEDGTQIESSSEVAEPVVGDKLTLEDGSNVPDAEHVLQSGFKVTTVDGIITEVAPIEEEIVPVEEEVVPSELEMEVSALKVELSELKNSINGQSESLESLKNLIPIIEKMNKSVSPEINTNKKEQEINNTIRIKK